MTEEQHKMREEITNLVNEYAKDYSEYVHNDSNLLHPLNPVIAIMNTIDSKNLCNTCYWNKLCTMQKSWNKISRGHTKGNDIINWNEPFGCNKYINKEEPIENSNN